MNKRGSGTDHFAVQYEDRGVLGDVGHPDGAEATPRRVASGDGTLRHEQE
jgi:hypothetical protein